MVEAAKKSSRRLNLIYDMFFFRKRYVCFFKKICLFFFRKRYVCFFKKICLFFFRKRYVFFFEKDMFFFEKDVLFQKRIFSFKKDMFFLLNETGVNSTWAVTPKLYAQMTCIITFDSDNYLTYMWALLTISESAAFACGLRHLNMTWHWFRRLHWPIYAACKEMCNHFQLRLSPCSSQLSITFNQLPRPLHLYTALAIQTQHGYNPSRHSSIVMCLAETCTTTSKASHQLLIGNSHLLRLAILDFSGRQTGQCIMTDWCIMQADDWEQSRSQLGGDDMPTRSLGREIKYSAISGHFPISPFHSHNSHIFSSHFFMLLGLHLLHFGASYAFEALASGFPVTVDATQLLHLLPFS
jgi:hypothetical protein